MTTLKPTHQSHAGFSLIELLVALVIFAFLMVSAFQLFDSILDVNERSQEDNLVQQDLSRFWLVIFQDMIHLRNRPHRDIQGDPEPPVQTSQYELMEFVRGGLPPVPGISPGGLQRVAYRLRNNTLERLSWAVVDLANGSEPTVEPLLSRVRSLKIEFLSPAREWTEVWPPLDSDTSTNGVSRLMPRMLRFTLILQDGRQMSRLLPGLSE